jgi:hypothetical protein
MKETDIVERLRKLAKLNAIGEGAAVVHKKGLTEAANEIERPRTSTPRIGIQQAPPGNTVPLSFGPSKLPAPNRPTRRLP